MKIYFKFQDKDTTLIGHNRKALEENCLQIRELHGFQGRKRGDFLPQKQTVPPTGSKLQMTRGCLSLPIDQLNAFLSTQIAAVLLVGGIVPMLGHTQAG